MRQLLLACAVAMVAAIPVTPAHPETPASQSASRDQGIERHRGDGHRRDHRRDRRRIDQAVVLDFSGASYDDRFNGRAFAPDSYNDWWHDSPSRSYPRWMQKNRNCERMWWSGGRWTC